MNYYNILNIPFDASQEDIKKSYRTLSLKYHPDKNSNDNDKTILFQNITQAYKILSNIESKTNYDFSISNCFHKNILNDNSLQDNYLNSNYLNNKNNIYNYDLSNKSNNINSNNIKSNNINSNIQKPKSIHIIKYITYEESYNGTKVPIEINRYIIENNEEYTELETVYIDILSGIDNNEIIIIKDKGNLYNGLYGNVKIKIKLLENKFFQRSGLDLIYLKDISFKESLCGFSFKLKHLNNKYYTVNNETGIIIHNNYNTIINNLGFTKDNITGNLIIRYNIDYSYKLNDEVLQNLRKLL